MKARSIKITVVGSCDKLTAKPAESRMYKHALVDTARCNLGRQSDETNRGSTKKVRLPPYYICVFTSNPNWRALLPLVRDFARARQGHTHRDRHDACELGGSDNARARDLLYTFNEMHTTGLCDLAPWRLSACMP
eukprot:6185912-Pleurochrysis_carterae.AAC.1